MTDTFLCPFKGCRRRQRRAGTSRCKWIPGAYLCLAGNNTSDFDTVDVTVED